VSVGRTLLSAAFDFALDLSFLPFIVAALIELLEKPPLNSGASAPEINS
jgi:hypothetical protein